MTDNIDPSIQFKVRLDASLQAAIELGKMRSDSLAHRQGRNPHSFQTYLSGQIVDLHRTAGFDQCILGDQGFTSVLSPPGTSDPKAVRMSLRLSDPTVVREIERLAEMTRRPRPHILYTIIRECTEIAERAFQGKHSTSVANTNRKTS